MIAIVKLTECEREVLQLKASGLESKDIAAARGGSKRTVDFHLANAYKKLRAENAIQAVNEARRLGEIN